MSQKMIKRAGFGAVLGLALWAAFTIWASWLRGQWQFPAVSGHLVQVYGSVLGAVTAQCVCAMICGMVWSVGALIFQETDWSLAVQTAVHAGACMVPVLVLAWVMGFMPHSWDGLMQYLRLFGVIYAGNWAIQYLRLRHHVKQFNEKLNQNKEETPVKNMKLRWPLAIAAMLALCICLPVAGMAMGDSGFFRDVIRGTAVVGTEYDHATAEIRVTAEYTAGSIAVQAVFQAPDKAPYTEQDALAVGTCRILDAAGKTVAEFDGSDTAPITGAQAVMVLPAKDLEPGNYTLQIDAFVGSKKADQDLPMKGYWECEITVE